MEDSPTSGGRGGTRRVDSLSFSSSALDNALDGDSLDGIALLTALLFEEEDCSALDDEESFCCAGFSSGALPFETLHRDVLHS